MLNFRLLSEISIAWSCGKHTRLHVHLFYRVCSRRTQ